MNETEAKAPIAAEAGDFNPEQKRYLEGFVAGAQIARAAKGVGGEPAGAPVASEPIGPDAAGLKAQNRLIASGGKLSDQEKFKREEHPSTPTAGSRITPPGANIRNPPIISAGASSVCFMSRRTKTRICAGCASRTALSPRRNSPASPILPSVTAAATRT
jgi:hypothetical protein